MMITPESNPEVRVLLVRARDLINQSQGLVKGLFSLITTKGECFCLLGALYTARHQTFPVDSPRYEKSVEFARYELEKTIKMMDIGGVPPERQEHPLLAYNDEVLLAGLREHEFSAEAKAPAVDLIDKTLDRLTKESS